MQLYYHYTQEQPMTIKEYVKAQGISRALLAKIKFQGGKIEVNHGEQNVQYRLQLGDDLVITLPEEGHDDAIAIDETPLDILYEDDAVLVVNKPAYVPSIPVSMYLNGTMVNRVKAHILNQDATSSIVHTVTRLDKDTTGVMLFAKNGYIHSLLDQQLRLHQIDKRYVALVSGEVSRLETHGHIKKSIRRKASSTIEREVTDAGGQEAWTEYTVLEQHEHFAYVRIQLHTGRTHQIRVHFQSLGCPLVGDTLYGTDDTMQRQALHCCAITFVHPLTKQSLHIEAPLPEDMQQRLQREGHL